MWTKRIGKVAIRSVHKNESLLLRSGKILGELSRHIQEDIFISSFPFAVNLMHIVSVFKENKIKWAERHGAGRGLLYLSEFLQVQMLLLNKTGSFVYFAHNAIIRTQFKHLSKY